MRGVCRDIIKHRPVHQKGIYPLVMEIMAKANSVGIDIFLPVDAVTCCGESGTSVTNCEDDLPPRMMELDCGPMTRLNNATVIHSSNTIIWNGPIGQIERCPFEAGSMHMMMDIVKATKNGATTIVTGESTVSMFKEHNCLHEVTHFNVWSRPSWNLLVDNALIGIDTLSNATPQCNDNSFCWNLLMDRVLIGIDILNGATVGVSRDWIDHNCVSE